MSRIKCFVKTSLKRFWQEVGVMWFLTIALSVMALVLMVLWQSIPYNLRINLWGLMKIALGGFALASMTGLGTHALCRIWRECGQKQTRRMSTIEMPSENGTFIHLGYITADMQAAIDKYASSIEYRNELLYVYVKDAPDKYRGIGKVARKHLPNMGHPSNCRRKPKYRTVRVPHHTKQ